MPDALEEQAKSDAVPVEVEIQAELIARRLVAYYVKIPMIRKGGGACRNVPISIKIDELKVSGKCLEIISVLVESVLGVIICLLVRKEISIRAEAPDVPKLLILVGSCIDVAVRVIVLADPCIAIPETALDAVGERLAIKFYLVSPGKRYLPSFGFQLAIVASWSAGSEDARKLRASDDHVRVGPDVIIPGERKPAFEDIPV